MLLGSGYFIEPVGQPVKLSADPAEAVPPSADPATYALNTAFPGTYFEEIGTYCFRGYWILTLKLEPVQYNPTTGELTYYPNLTVVINTAIAGGIRRCCAAWRRTSRHWSRGPTIPKWLRPTPRRSSAPTAATTC